MSFGEISLLCQKASSHKTLHCSLAPQHLLSPSRISRKLERRSVAESKETLLTAEEQEHRGPEELKPRTAWRSDIRRSGSCSLRPSPDCLTFQAEAVRRRTHRSNLKARSRGWQSMKLTFSSVTSWHTRLRSSTQVSLLLPGVQSQQMVVTPPVAPLTLVFSAH